MRTKLATNDGVPCWHCNSTSCEYILDDTVTYVSVRCAICKQADAFYLPRTMRVDSAADISAAHRRAIRLTEGRRHQ